MSALTACMQSQDCFSEEVFCAALVTDTRGLEDHGMNQETWAGLQEAQSGGLSDRVEYIESVDTRDYEKNIVFFAEQGVDVIFTIGPGMDDETLRSADLYPDSVFVGISQPQKEARKNLIPVNFAEDQMGFLAGALAARLSGAGVVGAVCETSDIDAMWRYCEGFNAGVKSVDENIKVLVFYRDDASRDDLFLDEVWGYETGQSLIQRGADVIFAAGGATGEGALRAAMDEQVLAIGAERDQSAEGYGVVTSVYGSASFEVQEVMRMIQGENLSKAGIGSFGYVPLNEKFSEGLTRELDSLLSALLNGEIQTGVSREKP